MKRAKTRPEKKSHFGSRRADVVKFLQRGLSTVSELAAHLHLTDNAVRSHLAALEREGLVTRRGSQPGKRRPHEVFQLTARAHKHLLQASDVTLNALIKTMKQRFSEQQLRQLLRNGGDELAARFATTGRTLHTRAQNAARLLNALGGSARVEKDGNRFCIRSQGCPLNNVVAEHPETCQLMESFLARALKADVREHCDRGKRSRCRFSISQNSVDQLTERRRVA
jgi:predicted ArsR family transcriptional regulator